MRPPLLLLLGLLLLSACSSTVSRQDSYDKKANAGIAGVDRTYEAKLARAARYTAMNAYALQMVAVSLHTHAALEVDKLSLGVTGPPDISQAKLQSLMDAIIKGDPKAQAIIAQLKADDNKRNLELTSTKADRDKWLTVAQAFAHQTATFKDSVDGWITKGWIIFWSLIALIIGLLVLKFIVFAGSIAAKVP